MPTIELLAEIEALKAKLHKSETQAEQYRRELSALGRDARICAYFIKTGRPAGQYEAAEEAACRILAATKEADNAK